MNLSVNHCIEHVITVYCFKGFIQRQNTVDIVSTSLLYVVILDTICGHSWTHNKDREVSYLFGIYIVLNIMFFL